MATEIVATATRIDDAIVALFHAKSILDVLTDCDQIDQNSAIPGALSAALDYIHQAQLAIGGEARHDHGD